MVRWYGTNDETLGTYTAPEEKLSADVKSVRETEARRNPLRRDQMPEEPIALFTEWLNEALASDVLQANAMTLATVSAAGRPAARVVLLRGFDASGFCFYTNYESRKGQELAQNPWAALLFWWGPLSRQIRIEGPVEKLTLAESDAYFNSRPRGSRLGAMASPQSQPIDSRQVLEARLQELEAQYGETEPERPPFWGGYRVRPQRMEFWQSGANRLHDRFCYTLADERWSLQRLAP